MNGRLFSSVRTVRRWVMTQRLVAVKFGKSLRFTLADIEAFIQQNRKNTPEGEIV
jgi:excisionase family DNA binding protein